MLTVSSKSDEVKPFELLYAARWNVPKAAANLGIDNVECKARFTEYCKAIWAQEAVSEAR